MGKGKSAATIIGGADGPTSVFVIKKNPKLTIRQKIEKLKNKMKRAYAEKSLKAESHSIDEVMAYIVNECGFVEIDNDEVQLEYKEMRASFIMQYKPELLGEYAVMPKLKSESKEDIQEHLKQFEERKQRAMEIPLAEFDIDFHKFQMPFDNINDNMHITVEKKYGYIGGGVSGNKRIMKRFKEIYKDIYRYYGVTDEDIRNKSKRYEDVIRALMH